MNDKPSQKLFWGCFIALITTSFGFIGRMFLLDDPAITGDLLGLDPTQVGFYKGAQIWPFAISIILFSLVIDKIGYKVSMVIAAVCQTLWAVMGIAGLIVAGNNPALGAGLIFWGGIVLGLGNGTVEAFINPVVATIFDKEKTKWLNILHAGWPGGLVAAGVITILMESMNAPWTMKLGIIAIPAIIYFVMLIGCKFPVQERVAAGVSYRDMLSEFGTVGALIAAILMYLTLTETFPGMVAAVIVGVLCAVFFIGFGVYTKSAGRPFMIFMILIMMPLATTEIGTDGWISNIMANAVTFHAGWILVYTSVIMMVLRFFAGPIVHSLSPIGLLIASAVLAIAGLAALSGVAGVVMIFVAATLYALGKTFFWPTMLGIVSEQTPKGGALTLNAISGIGMLAVGVLGFPYIGALQANKEIALVEGVPAAAEVQGLLTDGELSEGLSESKRALLVIPYETLDGEKFDELTAGASDETKTALADARSGSAQKALFDMAIFPFLMLLAYIGLYFYFKSKGGYKPVEMGPEGHHTSDADLAAADEF